MIEIEKVRDYNDLKKEREEEYKKLDIIVNKTISNIIIKNTWTIENDLNIIRKNFLEGLRNGTIDTNSYNMYSFIIDKINIILKENNIDIILPLIKNMAGEFYTKEKYSKIENNKKKEITFYLEICMSLSQGRTNENIYPTVELRREVAIINKITNLIKLLETNEKKLAKHK